MLPEPPRFFEHKLHEVAHAAVGLVKLEHHCEVYQLKLGEKTMAKYRYVTSNVGQPMAQCESVLELLYLMYDLTVTHKNLCERDVLHRDVSMRNVLRNVEEGGVTAEHIRSILNLEKPRPFALLTDLDNGAQISKMAEREPEGRRTGTPIFIALEVAGAGRIEDAPLAQTLSEYLEDNKNNLISAKGIVPVQFFEQSESILTAYRNEYILPIRRTAWLSNKPEKIVTHEPRHDVESMFWVLSMALARANPETWASQRQTPSEAYNDFCENMIFHTSIKSLRNGRGSYLLKSEETWEQILHPDLRDAAGLLHHMGRYLAIRTFDARREAWGKYHAHDMSRALLFSAIQKFRNNPVRLCTHLPRYATPPPGSRSVKGNTPIATGSSLMAGTSSQIGTPAGHSHAYDTRLKESFGRGIQKTLKRQREDDGYGDDVNVSTLPDRRNVKRPRLEQSALASTSFNETVRPFVTHETGTQTEAMPFPAIWLNYMMQWRDKCRLHPKVPLKEEAPSSEAGVE
ncbi:hypothetical protein CPB86DRAFT_812242 [Serendipita vermifera]|nr:hypothetical protein CPB86DRAFT_812242 [Serendipita vermifera]